MELIKPPTYSLFNAVVNLQGVSPFCSLCGPSRKSFMLFLQNLWLACLEGPELDSDVLVVTDKLKWPSIFNELTKVDYTARVPKTIW
jgi:hypothetical protein